MKRKIYIISNTLPFIDDLFGINDNGLFKKYFKEIQPEELDLNKKIVSSTNTSFFGIDLDIK